MCDFDGDGIPEIAIGHNFETDPTRSIGNVLIVKSGADPREPWTAREIDRVPTVNRLQWIDVDGNGKKVLLVAPMIGLNARPPDYADNVPVYLYRPGEWKRTLFTDQPRGILHSIFPVHWQGRGEQLMTADFLGIRVFLPKGGARGPYARSPHYHPIIPERKRAQFVAGRRRCKQAKSRSLIAGSLSYVKSNFSWCNCPSLFTITIRPKISSSSWR